MKLHGLVSRGWGATTIDILVVSFWSCPKEKHNVLVHGGSIDTLMSVFLCGEVRASPPNTARALFKLSCRVFRYMYH